MPTGSSRLALLATLTFSTPAAAVADGSALPIDIHEEPLANSLQDLAHQTGIELLYDRSLIGDRRAYAVRGRLPVALALLRLLSGTGLAVRHATTGAWIIERRPMENTASPPPDLAAPAILVVGGRTQDVDIRRRENDIQPYQVFTNDDLVEAHRDNLDQFFQSRVTTNTQIPGGGIGSAIDLRGLGSDETLILIDGDRLPGFPGYLSLGQPDINAIPSHAIERIETITGTAGGIYGLGALGGVVNVVLRHDYHGIELHGTTGISARGDARRLVIEGGVGFTPDHGRTDISIYASHSWQQPLLGGPARSRSAGTREDL